MRDKEYWSGKCSELYNKLLSIAFDHGISTSDKYYPKNAIVLAKRFADIKSNLESIGLFVDKILPRKPDGQHYSIKRAKSSALSTHLHQASNNEGLNNVDSNVDDVGGNSSALSSTADKAHVSAVYVDDVGNVDKSTPFEGWFSEISNVSDGDIPSEFLKPTPAPSTPPPQQLSIQQVQ